MTPQKINIELELTPEMAFFLCLYLTTTAQNDFRLQESLTPSGTKYLHDMAQNIMDQISDKTDFNNLKLRSTLSYLRNSDDLNDIPNDLMDLFN